MSIKENLHDWKHKLFFKNNLVSLMTHTMTQEKSTQNSALVPFASNKCHNRLNNWLLSDKKLVSVYGDGRPHVTKE